MQGFLGLISVSNRKFMCTTECVSFQKWNDIEDILKIQIEKITQHWKDENLLKSFIYKILWKFLETINYLTPTNKWSWNPTEQILET